MTVSRCCKMASPPLRKGGKRRRKYDCLFERLPRTATVIDSNSMVAALPATTKHLLEEYIKDRSPGSAEVADVLIHVSSAHPTHLRTKELCETLEAVTLIGSDINRILQRHPERRTDGRFTIYDLACGHSLAGVLLAYRFPTVNVVCIDRERRDCWTSYVDAFEKLGEKSKGSATVLSNLSHEEGDAFSVRPKEGDYLVMLHGCNELSPHALELAGRNGCNYAIMPCCLRDGLLGVRTDSGNHNWGIDDSSRYAAQVGYLAGKYGCEKIAAISHQITNRYLIVFG